MEPVLAQEVEEEVAAEPGYSRTLL